MTTHRSERRIWEVKTREGKPTGPRKIARGDVNQLLGQLEVEQRRTSGSRHSGSYSRRHGQVSHRLTGDAPACVLRPETTNEARPRILHKGLKTTGVARQAKQRPGPVDLSAERTSGANPGATDAERGQ